VDRYVGINKILMDVKMRRMGGRHFVDPRMAGSLLVDGGMLVLSLTWGEASLLPFRTLTMVAKSVDD
jgi:hypothetical protein